MKLPDLIAYICQTYPHSRELSKARLTKIIFLADWKSCQKNGEQLTEIKWYFDNYGPYVDDVVDSARECDFLGVEQEMNFYGNPKERIYIKDEKYQPKISADVIKIVDEVFEETKRLYWDDFIKHVYSTSPIRNSKKYSFLNLQKMAKMKI